MPSDVEKIEKLTRQYFDLLYFADADLIPACFHPEATVNNVDSGELIAIDMAGFAERIKTRQAPASIDEPRDDDLKTIDIASPTTALVKVEVNILYARFFDYLTLLKRDGEWKIISKVFHRVRKEA